jgi:hypothetical protein
LCAEDETGMLKGFPKAKGGKNNGAEIEAK